MFHNVIPFQLLINAFEKDIITLIGQILIFRKRLKLYTKQGKT
jgi:hypothetical protein